MKFSLKEVFLIFMLLMISSSAWATDWQTWQPTGEKFHADLPAGFTVTNNDFAGDGTNSSYTASAVVGDGYYVASYTILPQPVENGDNEMINQMFKSSSDNLLQGFPNAHLNSSKRITMNGHPVAEMIVDNISLGNGATSILHNIAVVTRDRLFQISYIGPAGTDASADAQRFLKSLTVQ